MKYVRPKKIPPVVFDNPEDLLISMIRGRRFEYECIVYYYNVEAPYEFRWSKQWDNNETGGDWGVAITDKMVHILVGKKLKEVDPIPIEVDTLLEVSDGSKKAKRYFSHWDEGRLFAFKNGATSATNDGIFGWSHWEFAEQEDK